MVDVRYEFDLLTVNWKDINNMSNLLNDKGKEGWHVIDVYDSVHQEFESPMHLSPKIDERHKNFILQRKRNEASILPS